MIQKSFVNIACFDYGRHDIQHDDTQNCDTQQTDSQYKLMKHNDSHKTS
jgi:hypothetical protein